MLLIAATNVASLSFLRSVSRGREIVIRTALGAGRGQIVRQLLAESLTLAALAGAAGLSLAHVILQIIQAVKSSDLVRLNEVNLDTRVLAVAFGFCLLTGVRVGLTPAIAAARRNLQPSCREGARGVTGGLGARRVRRALVVSESALAIMLLVGAGLLVRSLWSIENIDPGFRPERVLSMQLASPAFEATARRADFYSRVLEEVEALPGIESASIISDLFVGGSPERILTVEGAAGNATERLRFRSDEASAGFFKTMGTPLVRGRFFTAADGRESSRVAIINETMARRLWPQLDPIGRRFKFGPAHGGTPWFTVAGVVGDMRRQGLEKAPIPQIFEPLPQNPSRLATLLVRTSTDEPLRLADLVGAAVRRVDKKTPLYGVTTLEARLGLFLAERRFQTALLLAFSAAALLMAAIGIYGLVRYSIATRTHEIGIRMAVGARSGEIFRMVIREGLELSLTGLTLGLVGALWVGSAGSSLLFGVSGTDPLTLVTVSFLLTAAAIAAC